MLQILCSEPGELTVASNLCRLQSNMSPKANGMNTLFFLISICGLVAVALWAHRNDQRASVAGQDGMLAMKVPVETDVQEQPPEPVSVPSFDTKAEAAPGRRPRKRFISV
ncbi:MAG: hypothetical protein AAF543_19775 [Pseudomonadota bacterium]